MNSAQESPQVKKKLVKTLKTSQKLKKIMAWYFIKGKLYSKLPWKQVAWSVSGFPTEFLWAYNVYPFLPENCATIAAARHKSQELIEYAEACGYCRDLCSYFKTNIGAYDSKLPAQFGGLEKPDLMTCTNTVCDTHVKWFQTQSRNLNVPLFVWDIPAYVSGSDEKTMNRYLDYVTDQFWEFTDFMYDHTGKKFNQKKFIKTVKKADELAVLWRELFKYRKQIPAPLGYADTLGDVFPMFALPGKNRGIKFYRELVEEVKEAAKVGKGVVEDEKYRLLFEGIPFWYKIKFFHQLANFGAVVTYEPYTWSFGVRREIFDDDIDRSLREMAKSLIHTPYWYNLETRVEYFKKVIEEYKIDGVILHNNLSCRPSTTGMADLKQIIQEELGIPVLLLTCDMNDPRAFSEAPMQTRLESFIELLESRA
ncbi:MAG: 2-hydroxyacyl-CoA dehydratase [Candidatus Lokiarchaeota archaeon]|nr:2-hydroxyacyl-CoA dehydratase [Candidatus Lokiarchaeota archaeon]